MLVTTNLDSLKRISTIVYDSNSLSDNNGEINQSQSLQHKYYYYESENPELIDSLVVHLQTSTTQNNVVISESDTTYTLDYEGEMYIENGNRHYSYTRSDGFNYTLMRDNQYRIIYKAPYDDNHPDSYNSWIYNENGRLDETTWRNDLESNYRCVFNYADEQNSPVLSGTVYYYFSDIGWQYDSSFSYTYPADNYSTPYYLFTEEALDVAENNSLLRLAINPYYQASSFLYNDFYNITSSSTEDGYQALLETDDGYGNTRSYELVFNMDGYVSHYQTGNSSMYSGSTINIDLTWDDLVGNEDEIDIFPVASLQCYPNPFKSQLNIDYSFPKNTGTAITVYNIMGQKVKELTSGQQGKGKHSITWDGRDSNGKPVAKGIYLIGLKSGDKLLVSRKIILNK
jgi:hypothetical protein